MVCFDSFLSISRDDVRQNPPLSVCPIIDKLVLRWLTGGSGDDMNGLDGGSRRQPSPPPGGGVVSGAVCQTAEPVQNVSVVVSVHCIGRGGVCH